MEGPFQVCTRLSAGKAGGLGCQCRVCIAPWPVDCHVAAPGALPTPGSLDSSSPVSSKPEAFFAKLQEFREANKEECIHSDPG